MTSPEIPESEANREAFDRMVKCFSGIHNGPIDHAHAIRAFVAEANLDVMEAVVARQSARTAKVDEFIHTLLSCFAVDPLANRLNHDGAKVDRVYELARELWAEPATDSAAGGET